MNYKIVTDSSSNLFSLEGADFASVPLKINTAAGEYVDDLSLDVEAMVLQIKATKGRSGTACPSIGEWLETFRGADRVFAITITGALSGSYAACVQAAREYEQEHPGVRVQVIDSLSAGPELALLAERIRDQIQAGQTFEQIVADVERYQRHTHLSFCLESLTNLARNGRCSPAVAAVAGVLGIRLVGMASAEGTLEPRHKPRGERKAREAVYQDMLAHGYDGGKVRIAHCMNIEGAQGMAHLIRTHYPQAQVVVEKCGGLCGYYAEKGGLMIGFEDREA